MNYENSVHQMLKQMEISWMGEVGLFPWRHSYNAKNRKGAEAMTEETNRSHVGFGTTYQKGSGDDSAQQDGI
ncbi:hypothetical protein KKI24_15340, partial [bacterium]|nr:hypothetical protein [bacterium]